MYPITPPKDLPEKLRAMKRQQVGAYKVLDYLNPSYSPESAGHEGRLCPTRHGTRTMPSTSEEEASTFPPTECSAANITCESDSQNSSNCSDAGVNEDWRSKICEWSYQVIDHFDYDREIVAVSLNYVDRYLCKRPVNKRTFQLVAMTSLYLACKIYDPKKLRMSSLIELSRGYFTDEHIAAMEMSILSKLGWQVHPPTPLTFAKHYILLLKPAACEPSLWSDIMEVTKFLTELAVLDYGLAILKPSSVGLAALMTAMEGVAEERLAMVDKQIFFTNVHNVAQVSPNDPEIMNCRIRLRTIYYEGTIYQQEQDAEAAATAQAYRERVLAAERIAAESPNAVDAHPVMQVDTPCESNPSKKNDGGWRSPDGVASRVSASLSSAISSSADLRSAIALEADNQEANETKKRRTY